MAKEQKIEVDGRVIDNNHDIYTVELDNKVVVTARVSGKIRLNMIRILAGDRVTVALSPTDLTHGIIKYRKKEEKKDALKEEKKESFNEENKDEK